MRARRGPKPPPYPPPLHRLNQGVEAWLRKRIKAKKTSVAPEHAGNRGMEVGPVKDTVASTKHGQGTLHPLTWPSYGAIVKFYDERMETPGIDASDAQLAKLSELLYIKRKRPVRFEELQCRLAARLIPARVAYAEQHGVALALVTLEDLEESPEGVQHWLDQGIPSGGAYANENVVVVADAEETAMRISSVLNEREEWLCASGLDSATVMDMVQRDEFLRWSVKKYLDVPGNCVPDESYRDSLLRFCREQERRVGSTQIWQVLSHTGQATPEDVRNAFKECGTPTVSPPRPWPKKMPHRKPLAPSYKAPPEPLAPSMGHSCADGAGEPVAGILLLPESWACEATLVQDKETAEWVALQSRKTRQDIRAKRHMERQAMSREDQATMSREDEATVVWFASLSKRQRQDVLAIAETTLAIAEA